MEENKEPLHLNVGFPAIKPKELSFGQYGIHTNG